MTEQDRDGHHFEWVKRLPGGLRMVIIAAEQSAAFLMWVVDWFDGRVQFAGKPTSDTETFIIEDERK